jgi:hypothetical protein
VHAYVRTSCWSLVCCSAIKPACMRCVSLSRVMFWLLIAKIQGFVAAAFVAEKFPCLLFMFSWSSVDPRFQQRYSFIWRSIAWSVMMHLCSASYQSRAEKSSSMFSHVDLQRWLPPLWTYYDLWLLQGDATGCKLPLNEELYSVKSFSFVGDALSSFFSD